MNIATYPEIEIAVCDRLGVPTDEIRSTKRSHGLVTARAAITVLCRHFTGLSYPEITVRLRGRISAHSTVIDAYERAMGNADIIKLCRDIAAEHGWIPHPFAAGNRLHSTP